MEITFEDEAGEKWEDTSWAVYHASHEEPGAHIITPNALLPLFQEAMIRHSMDVVRNAVEHLNPGKIPILTFNQPLYVVAKQILWKWLQKCGEDQFVVMSGGLHIEMTALKTTGD